jgi:hypothetical protein
LQRRWLFSFGKSEQSKGRKHQPPRGRNMQKKKEENKRQRKATKPGKLSDLLPVRNPKGGFEMNKHLSTH